MNKRTKRLLLWVFLIAEMAGLSAAQPETYVPTGTSVNSFTPQTNSSGFGSLPVPMNLPVPLAPGMPNAPSGSVQNAPMSNTSFNPLGTSNALGGLNGSGSAGGSGGSSSGGSAGSAAT